jgi:predicted transcriptional regulator
MTDKRQIRIGVSTGKAQGEEFIAAWERAERGLPPEEPVDRLYFESLSMLLKVFSPKRMELLQTVRAAGPISVRKLSHELKRDYKNVHTDVSELARIGLIEISDKKQLSVPWDVISIAAEIPLLAKAT